MGKRRCADPFWPRCGSRLPRNDWLSSEIDTNTAVARTVGLCEIPVNYYLVLNYCNSFILLVPPWPILHNAFRHHVLSSRPSRIFFVLVAAANIRCDQAAANPPALGAGGVSKAGSNVTVSFCAQHSVIVSPPIKHCPKCCPWKCMSDLPQIMQFPYLH